MVRSIAMTSPRVVSLDVLRGIAILGTLGTNIWIFTHPEGLLGYLTGTPDSDWRPLETGLQTLTQGKFLGLLTLMFGIGLALQQRSAVRAGDRWPGTYPWRALLLLIDGLLHFVFMTEFDVLMGYAITGWIVSYLLITSPRTQRRIIVVAGCAHVVLLSLIAAAVATQPAIDGPREPLNPNPYADGSWWDLVLFRLDNAVLFRLESLLIFPMSIALFLLGAKLFDAGVLDSRGAALRKRLMWLGFGIAAPIDVALEVTGWNGAGLLLARYGTAPVVALGILAAVAQFYQQRTVGFCGGRLADVGRMALSCYVFQNLIASALCYGWGLGLAASTPAQFRVPATAAIYLVVATATVLFAHLWLRRWRRGPVEWLWNTSYRAVAASRLSYRY